jgi:hypothetical protein
MPVRLLQEHADELASLRAAHPRTDVGHALCCDLFQCVSGTSGHSWQDIGQDVCLALQATASKTSGRTCQ